MGKKIVVVNAGPRKGWNTDILLSEASDGVVSAGSEIEYAKAAGKTVEYLEPID